MGGMRGQLRPALFAVLRAGNVLSYGRKRVRACLQIREAVCQCLGIHRREQKTRALIVDDLVAA